MREQEAIVRAKNLVGILRQLDIADFDNPDQLEEEVGWLIRELTRHTSNILADELRSAFTAWKKLYSKEVVGELYSWAGLYLAVYERLLRGEFDDEYELLSSLGEMPEPRNPELATAVHACMIQLSPFADGTRGRSFIEIVRRRISWGASPSEEVTRLVWLAYADGNAELASDACELASKLFAEDFSIVKGIMEYMSFRLLWLGWAERWDQAVEVAKEFVGLAKAHSPAAHIKALWAYCEVLNSAGSLHEARSVACEIVEQMQVIDPTDRDRLVAIERDARSLSQGIV